jgi:serine/threonine protein kinase
MPIVRLEDFQVLGVLGKGGYGEVFRAFQWPGRREVALKVMRKAGRHTSKVHTHAYAHTDPHPHTHTYTHTHTHTHTLSITIAFTL